jgi:hypothetical protein
MSPLVVYISRDVVFDEKVFTFASLHSNVSALLKQEIVLLTSSTSSLHEGAKPTNDHTNSIVPITGVQQAEEVEE